MDRLRPRQRPVFSGFTKAEKLSPNHGSENLQQMCGKLPTSNVSFVLASYYLEYIVNIEKMEKLFMESRELLQSKEFSQKLARNFSSSSARAGKPIVKWNEVQNWFTTRQQESEVKVPSVTNTYKDECGLPQTCLLNDGDQSCQILKGLVSKVGEKVSDLSELEFEAKSSTDGAWYDVDMFLSHRVTSSGETLFDKMYCFLKEVRVRFVGFGAEEDEWVNVKKAVRGRSIHLNIPNVVR
ncbi:protein SAWADEE HOMEODOMAIN-like protein 2-like isoform X6 [Gossypium australe]|uniref:Protein SAWADEE HOMEODOMAIN-like protein 2-like isoform X6 n=1 Tax=Gossypium australe TaxID=47621 RepID=A0A5B6X9B6_9ROSI|nr:protein SAWADEE HOMEODOMAIN-like protein 2-like isoform X6 [Gossypium australe]